MLRTLLIATALLTASGATMASGGYGHGRVISVEPHFVISFGTRHHDGFRILYESGGHRYWTHSYYHPGPYIMLPPPHRVYYGHPGYHYRWEEDDRRHWKGHRDDWHDDRRDHREHRRHDRH